MSFTGKVVIVTGASSGIGAATAVLFAGEGARVALVARNETKLSNVAQQCAAHGAQPLIIKADIANEEEAKNIVKKTVDKFGKLDILINNAGIMRFASVFDPNYLQIYDDTMKTNLRSVVQLTNLAAPHLTATKGNIVNVSSVAAFCVLAENIMSYAVSKAGLDHFTRCVALELAASGVRVNSVNPGPVTTEIITNSGLVPVGADGETWNELGARAALGKVGSPDEIAYIILFLASDKAKSVTGSMFLCDNGFMLKN
ncbi:uncharacterized oxidoreductase MexAM1_META1p0182-like [Choristoneura fumiferana]|uniref:uncharacterized oxidoreductase MexAM1_META1p0182-like n=1 Tax=Choristoneura fumiferana TaxID=7141 RepID=UPI003D15ABCB